MVVDSNLGFNKVNVVVREYLSYDVNLSDPENPRSSLSVVIENNASGNPVCTQKADYGDGSYSALINRCYWNYLRVYTLSDTNLITASPYTISGSELMNGKDLPAKIDNLVDENNELYKGYGTLMVIPGEAIHSIKYNFILPAAILRADGENITYQLHVQKQAGTLSTPIQLKIQLPPSALIIKSSLPGEQQGDVLIINSNLRKDLEYSITLGLNKSVQNPE
jgi:hypothetical protein